MSIAEAIDIGVGSFRIEGPDEAVAKLFENLRLAQIEFDPVLEDAQGQAGQRSFSYADYSALTRATRPYLVKHGITLLQPLHSSDAGTAVTTTILAGHGARISSSFSFRADPNPQNFGKDHTYYRRYQLQAILGLAGEDADDARLSRAAKEKNGFTEASKATNGASKQPLQEPSKPAPQAAAKAAPEKPKAVDEVKGTEEKPVDARPVNARIIDGMKQLGWNMDALKTFYKAEIDKKGFDKADNLPAPVKEKLYDLMVEKHKVARF